MRERVKNKPMMAKAGIPSEKAKIKTVALRLLFFGSMNFRLCLDRVNDHLGPSDG